MQAYDYDLLVIGSGPAGQRAAIQASKLNKKVGLVERSNVIGGICINTGTIPSKSLRESILHLSGYRERTFYGSSYSVKQNITMADLLFRTGHVTRHEIDITRHQLDRNRVELLVADASFVDPHTVRLAAIGFLGYRDVTARSVVIATGTRPTKDASVPFDGESVLSSDDILTMTTLPRSLAVVGAGVIGCEYASMLAALGVRVTLIDKRSRLLPFIDAEIVETFSHQLRENRVTLRLAEEVSGVDVLPPAEAEHAHRVRIRLASGKEILTEKALYSVGRTGCTEGLNLSVVGIMDDGRGRLSVNENYQTTQPHIYAVGDVIGFPSLASTSMEQGRLAACHAFGAPMLSVPELFPFGIYTIPEISVVGPSEDDLTQQKIPYEIGKASYREIARGQIVGDTTGLLKLIFHRESRQLLGVHIVGEGASELIHIGQAVMAFDGKIDHFIHTVFNYPTLAECYKTAALDGMNRLS